MRYVVFEFAFERPPLAEAKREIEATLAEQLGKIALAREEIKFMEERYDEQSGTGLVKGEDADKIKAALLFCGSAINIKGVSGTVNGTKRFR